VVILRLQHGYAAASTGNCVRWRLRSSWPWPGRRDLLSQSRRLRRRGHETAGLAG